MAHDDVIAFIRRALEASIDACPKDSGLTYAELAAAADAVGIRPGELRDELSRRRDLIDAASGDRYHLPASDATFVFNFIDHRPWRNLRAFDFVKSEFMKLRKELGGRNARVGREALVTRATSQGLDECDVDVALAWFLAARHVVLEPSEVLKASDSIVQNDMLPSAIAAQHYGRQHYDHERREAHVKKILDLVRDLTARRSDGRPAHSDPLRAFAPVITQLGYPGFDVWWRQHMAEYGALDAATAPTASIVLAAALAEAALCFVFRRAAATKLTMDSDMVTKPETTWSFIQLVKLAKKGAVAPLLDGDLGARCERLNELRQRIHVGRFLSAGAKPHELDIREEEAREAAETLKRLVRRILDWLAQHGTS